MNLVTIVHDDISTLSHFLKYYSDKVNDYFILVHKNSLSENDLERVRYITEDFGGIHEEFDGNLFDWNLFSDKVNEIKRLKPNDWWIVAETDEFHEYTHDIDEVIDTCDELDFQYIVGGLVDRINIDGKLLKITDDSDLEKDFELYSNLRYILSNNCPLKIPLSKGNVEITSGYHYRKIGNKYVTPDNEDDIRFPIKLEFPRVNKFMWHKNIESVCRKIINTNENYTYFWEYQEILTYLDLNNYMIDVNDSLVRFESMEENLKSYKKEILSFGME